MYFHESIFSLILVICIVGLLYPYLMKGAGGLIRLTSVYRPISLVSFLLYSLIIVLQPSLGPNALAIVPFLAMNGACCMAMEFRALDRKALDPGQLAVVDVRGQLRRAAIILGAILLMMAAIIPLPLNLAAVCVNIMLAIGFSWAAAEAILLWGRRPSFNLMTTLLGCVLSSIGMTARGIVYMQHYGTATNLVFPEPDGAFMPRVLASFGVLIAAIAFNYEYLGRLADHERMRGLRLEERLFATLARILEHRTRRPADKSLLFGECAYLIARTLEKNRWPPIRLERDLPSFVRRNAPVADIGMIGVPDTAAADLAHQHPTIGANFFRAINAGRNRSRVGGGRRSIATAAAIAGNYTEHWDGSGGPEGKIGTAIPPGARIVSVARAYVDARWAAPGPDGREAALETIRAGRGTRFDPLIVDALIAAEPEVALLFDDSLSQMGGQA